MFHEPCQECTRLFEQVEYKCILNSIKDCGIIEMLQQDLKFDYIAFPTAKDLRNALGHCLSPQRSHDGHVKRTKRANEIERRKKKKCSDHMLLTRYSSCIHINIEPLSVYFVFHLVKLQSNDNYVNHNIENTHTKGIPIPFLSRFAEALRR